MSPISKNLVDLVLIAGAISEARSSEGPAIETQLEDAEARLHRILLEAEHETGADLDALGALRFLPHGWRARIQ